MFPLDAVPSKTRQVSFHTVALVPYPKLVQLVEKMSARHSRVIFNSLTPIADEIWNFIDGKRSIAEIFELVCLEFDFDIEPELLLPLVEALHAVGLVSFNPGSGIAESPTAGSGVSHIISY